MVHRPTPPGRPSDSPEKLPNFADELGIARMVWIPPELKEKYDQDSDRRWRVLRKAAHQLAQKIRIDTGGDLAEDLARYMEYLGLQSYLQLTGESIETGADARDALHALANASAALQAAIRALGRGALKVLTRETGDTNLFALADSQGLVPAWDDPTMVSSYQVPWVRKLKALEDLANLKADRIQAAIRKGGPKALGKLLVGSDQSRVIWFCLKCLRRWGADPALTLPMAQAIHTAMTGETVSAQWGRKMFARLSQSNPSQTP